MHQPLLRWVVAEAGETLGARLRALSVAPTSLAGGVVFVNRERVTEASRPLTVGDVIEVYALRNSGTHCQIVEQRGTLVVVDKPAALASEPTRGGEDSVARQVSELLNGRVQVLSRLDVGVSGLMLVSTSAAATTHVGGLRARGRYRRQYLAIVAGHLPASFGTWNVPVAKGRKRLASTTHFEVLERVDHPGTPRQMSLLLLAPVTGRTHQLRQHTCAAGTPIAGDRRYQGATRVVTTTGKVLSLDRIMLHSTRLQLADVAGSEWLTTRPPPEAFVNLWTAVGGSSEIVKRACEKAFLTTSEQ